MSAEGVPVTRFERNGRHTRARVVQLPGDYSIEEDIGEGDRARQLRTLELLQIDTYEIVNTQRHPSSLYLPRFSAPPFSSSPAELGPVNRTRRPLEALCPAACGSAGPSAIWGSEGPGFASALCETRWLYLSYDKPA